MATSHLRAAEKIAKTNRDRLREVNRLRASWVAGSELTPAQLALIQPTLKQAFLEREERRAA